MLLKEECGGRGVVCFGTVCGVFGVNSNHHLLPYGQLWRPGVVSQSQSEAAYSTGVVTGVCGRGWLGLTVWCDGGGNKTKGQRWSL